jgi:DNA invertase Pin-like site-specific DNA recombinase
MKKAISYIRFSTVAQGEKGRDSTIRQKRALEDALKKWNLKFDKEFIDDKSGYKGRHIQKGGAMHEILRLSKAGELAGKVLVVEDWDRVGRLKPMAAIRLLMDILENDVDMVVGEDGGKYFSADSVNDNYDEFSYAVRDMQRGRRESERKAGMAQKKYQSRMDALSNGEKVALNCYPFWIGMERNHEGKCTGNHYLKKEMVKLVQKIFSLYLSGIGTQKIAAVLNKSEIPTPLFNNGNRADSKRGWYQGRILRLIKDRAVLGFYQDKKNAKEYKAFDEIISEQDFYKANKKRKERVCFAGRRTERVNPFSGLIKCANCGGAVSIHPTGTKGKPYNYLQCRFPLDKNCGRGGLRFEKFEESFWGFLIHIDDLKLGQNPKSNEPLKSLEIQGRIDAIERKIAIQNAALGALDDPKDAPSILPVKWAHS